MLSCALNRKRKWFSSCSPRRTVVFNDVIPEGIRDARLRLGINNVPETPTVSTLNIGPRPLNVGPRPLDEESSAFKGPPLWCANQTGHVNCDWIPPDVDPGLAERAANNLPERKRPLAPMTPNATASGSSGRRGSVATALAVAGNEDVMARAREHLSDGMLAPGTVRTKNAMRKTWASLCQARGVQFLPLTPSVMMEIAAILKMAMFRSGSAYLIEMRTAHIRAGHPWTNDLELALKDCKRSLQRGLGPPCKAAEFRLEWLVDVKRVDFEDGAWPAAHWLVWPFGIRFLLREVELACISFNSREISFNRHEQSVTLLLTASKTDPSAKGVRRTLACDCDSSPDNPKY